MPENEIVTLEQLKLILETIKSENQANYSLIREENKANNSLNRATTKAEVDRIDEKMNRALCNLVDLKGDIKKIEEHQAWQNGQLGRHDRELKSLKSTDLALAVKWIKKPKNILIILIVSFVLGYFKSWSYHFINDKINIEKTIENRTGIEFKNDDNGESDDLK